MDGGLYDAANFPPPMWVTFSTVPELVRITRSSFASWPLRAPSRLMVMVVPPSRPRVSSDGFAVARTVLSRVGWTATLHALSTAILSGVLPRRVRRTSLTASTAGGVQSTAYSPGLTMLTLPALPAWALSRRLAPLMAVPFGLKATTCSLTVVDPSPMTSPPLTSSTIGFAACATPSWPMTGNEELGRTVVRVSAKSVSRTRASLAMGVSWFEEPCPRAREEIGNHAPY